MAALETIYKTEISSGEYGCGDLGISTNDWIELLKSPEASQYLETLLCFLREPKHAATCNAVSRKYGKTAYYYNAKVTNFSKWVQKKLNRFQVLNPDGSITYWCIAMQKGWDTKQGFKWQLRNELVEALRHYLMTELINQYRNLKEPFNGFYEEYKWNLLDKTEGKSILEIINSLRGVNLVDNPRVDSVLKSLRENTPNELTTIVERLIDETKPIDERVANYKKEMRDICPKNWRNCANDERTAATILMCKYPEKYTAYKDEIYQLICDYFGFESRKVGKKFSHYTDIINNFTANFGNEIQEIMLSSISGFKNKPLNLAVQTLFWCMRNIISTKLNIKDTNEFLNEETMPSKKYQHYIDLLQEAHNLVLTGAPGTGKTYMAQKIAEEMGAVTKFVQFHPSYDYTDFVEGLRPIEKEDGQMGFERRDGIFKDFCKEALASEGKTEGNFEEALQLLKNDLKEQGEIEIPSYLKSSKTRTICLSQNDTISVKGETNPVYSDDRILRYMRTKNREELGNDTYTFSIGEHVLKEYVAKTSNKTFRKPFVLIIDEINRGEASKIFGELFYAIDPGYRGKKDYLVQTQYQNLVPETDVFAKGFYVPENVYILATMNDIDRSVESMDFAMRRRFTWQEVTPEDTESMLDSLTCAVKAKNAMHRLNNAIAETDGLGAAYMIGPSYFLKLGDTGGDFEKLWKMNIEPLLKEYLRGFRKSTEILEKFSKAYFNNNDIATDQPQLIDED